MQLKVVKEKLQVGLQYKSYNDLPDNIKEECKK